MTTADIRTPRFTRGPRVLEIGFWIAFTVVNVMANTTTVLIEHRRTGNPLPLWQPLVWESSSNVIVLLLVPAIVAFTRRVPLHWGVWRRHLPWHVAGSVVFSVVHVAGMVALCSPSGA